MKDKSNEILDEILAGSDSVSKFSELGNLVREATLSAITELETSMPDPQQILRISISAELSAINLYRTLADLTKDPLIKKVLLNVAKEEKTHVAEFEALLNKIDPEQVREDQKGAVEVEKIQSDISANT